MRLPILVFKNNELSIFKTVKEAENYLTPVSVYDKEFSIYSGDAYFLKQKIIDVEYKIMWLFKRTHQKVELELTNCQHIEKVKELLINVLYQSDETQVIYQVGTELDYLIALAINKLGYKKDFYYGE